MPQHEKVYTISEEDIPLSARNQLGYRGDIEEGPPQTRSSSARAGRRPSASMRDDAGARPLVAASLSLFLPGTGQLYNRQGKLGLLLLLTLVFAVTANWGLIQTWSSLRETADLFTITERDLMAGVTGANFILLMVMLWGVHQAFRHAERTLGAFHGLDHPVLSGLASLVMPGWGQLLNAQPAKALAFFFCVLSALFSGAMLRFTPFARVMNIETMDNLLAYRPQTALALVAGTACVATVIWVVSIYDAVLVARYRRRS